MPHLELIFPHSKSADGFNARRVPHLAIALGAWPTTEPQYAAQDRGDRMIATAGLVIAARQTVGEDLPR
jgi:hypothetical protein